ncbi:hypothetical protein POI8812_01443 [Pontivivens insulae]|uniref:Uncharacterized protein n=1 Tax=Pontivivens insulae TaxID=1639689 RepID=A0A2R8AA72_9RHOB|nr:hypothetical protein DFR53_2180 [Pontivivens insulae]SPF29137.1 hypothetical protein POI8812_01443 [Pontivivens insulae]
MPPAGIFGPRRSEGPPLSTGRPFLLGSNIRPAGPAPALSRGPVSLCRVDLDHGLHLVEHLLGKVTFDLIARGQIAHRWHLGLTQVA